jgi:hypothetical protein
MSTVTHVCRIIIRALPNDPNVKSIHVEKGKLNVNFLINNFQQENKVVGLQGLQGLQECFCVFKI